jgi:hypothetical protein
MIWMQMVKELDLKNEAKFIELLRRNPCEPLVYILKVEEQVGVSHKDYYRVLMQKFEEEINYKMLKVVHGFEYLLREDRDRERY